MVLSAGRPARAGYRLLPCRKKPLMAVAVVRGVITKVPFSLLLRIEPAILSVEAQKSPARGRAESDSES